MNSLRRCVLTSGWSVAALMTTAFAAAPAEARLEAVTELSLPGVTLTQAETVPAGSFKVPYDGRVLADLPAFCRIAATLKPAAGSSIRIEVWLPREHWNGRFLGTGNGGGAGMIVYAALAAGLKLGYATANTDLGTAPDAEVAGQRPDCWADFGYRATHEMTTAAKAMLTAFYGRPARHTYFVGGSTGGQQALSEAQRYPEDYDGIIAGAPGNNRTHLHTMFVWNWQAVRATPGSALSADALDRFTRAVVRARSPNDGGAPGDDFLTDPRLDHFDPARILAGTPGVADRDSLTAAQVAALQKIYAGPTNPRTGERIHCPPPLGAALESERSIGPAAQPEIPEPPSRFYPFRWALGPTFDYAKFDFDRDLAQMDAKLADLLNANNPDLSGLRRRGGKLLMYTGTADATCPFEDTVNYYERVVRAQGGLAATQTFFRYFLVPGMAHVSGGAGLNDFGQRLALNVPQDSDHDALLALVKWVEQGVAPDRIVATAFKGGEAANGIRFQRPIYPYPKFAHYRSGDVNAPDSYEGVDHVRGEVLAPAAVYLR